MTSSRRTNGSIALRFRLVAAGVILALTACGSGTDSESSPDPVQEPVDTIAGGTDDADAGTDVGTVASSSAADSAPDSPDGGRYDVGDTYTDGEFDAVYLGLAKIPVGPDIWPDGACYTVLLEATYLDPYDYGNDRFSPSVDGYLTDGRVADGDDSGVGCDQKVLADSGYERAVDTSIASGETAKIYSGAFHVSAADVGLLDVATLFGGGPESGLVAEVTLDLTS